ncbi:MFS transporter [Pandoraea nosoerga]|nr:MFS transporter [Pandoraea nosoerga]MBN4667705.1 MFS transporter [Pandoraea nosoerga]MBN4677996.1 MFS transporter [Pandoraea nosoerga]MBN4679499.1 MFS transporter [Pandoraea nosoerga]MBN4743412.1 MFS transporter [Pandoraea nosoerga]
MSHITSAASAQAIAPTPCALANPAEPSEATRALSDPASEIAQRQVVRKISRRLLGFLFVLFLFSFLDRINVGFAALTMSRDLGLTSTMFGMASSVFYLTYVLCGVPSNLMLVKFGARRWIGAILVAWGLASSATMFAHDATSLYLIRAVVGITEAGFLPGMLLYMGDWFPSTARARANAWFMIAMPVTSALGAAASGYLLRLDGVAGLAGWQWLFVLEGLPTVLLGLVTWWYLDDKPADARWLSAAEKQTLLAMIARDRMGAAARLAPRANAADQRMWRAMLAPSVAKFALGYFCLVNTLSLASLWIPQIVKSFGTTSSNVTIGLLAAIPSVCTIAGMIWWGRRSDRLQERRWHLVLPMLFSAAGWGVTCFAPEPSWRLAGVAMASTGAYTAMAIFWTVPERTLAPHTRALGLAVINAVGNLGSALSPIVVGALRDWTHSFTAGLMFAAASLLAGVAVLWFAPLGQHRDDGTRSRHA